MTTTGMSHPAPWLTATALAVGNGNATPAAFRAAQRVLDALTREGALLTPRHRELLRPSTRDHTNPADSREDDDR